MRSPEGAAHQLAATFGIPVELAQRDALATIRSWGETGLLGPPQGSVSPGWDGLHGEGNFSTYFSIEGTRFVLRTDSSAIMQEVLPRLNGSRIDVCEPDVTIGIWRVTDDRFVIEAGNDSYAVEEGIGATRAVLLQELVRLARPGRQWLALLHAAASAVDGRCILFPASSHSGKSTLATALMASGFAVYSDDFVGIEAPDLQIPAMPFPVAVRQGSWEVLQSWVPDLESCPIYENDSGESTKFLPLAQPKELSAGRAVALVFSQWNPGAQLTLEKLSTQDVVRRLNESGFWVRHDPASIATFLGWLERMPKLALRYGDLAEAVAEARAIAAED